MNIMRAIPGDMPRLLEKDPETWSEVDHHAITLLETLPLGSMLTIHTAAASPIAGTFDAPLTYTSQDEA